MESKKKSRFYDWSVEELTKNHNIKPKKTLAMHICCAPCSLFPIEFLYDTFHLILLYDNSNIYPESEFIRRKNELIKYLDFFNKDKEDKIELVIFDYNNEEYMQDLKPFSNEKEGGKRCFLCYEKRMEAGYKYASEHNYDYFTTVMSISRQKNSEKLNEIGAKLQEKYSDTQYFFSDFKKKKGDDRAHELKTLYNLYNQQYCGCIYSYEAYLKKIKNKNM